jgi:hypothetical protein
MSRRAKLGIPYRMGNGQQGCYDEKGYSFEYACEIIEVDTKKIKSL